MTASYLPCFPQMVSLQQCPEPRLLHAVICPFAVQKVGAFDEMAQDKERLLDGHVRSENRLTRCPEPILLSSADNVLTKCGCIYSAERLPNSYGLVVGNIRPVTLLEDIPQPGKT